MVERATSEAVSSWVSISGRRLAVSQPVHPAALSRSPSSATAPASGRSRSGVMARRSGTAVQVALTLVANRPTNVSRATISGPYVVKSRRSTPVLSSCSAAQRAPNGSSSWKTPTTRTLTGRGSSRPRTVYSRPVSNPVAVAAGSEITASTGSSPVAAGFGQAPETSLACRSRPS